MNTTQIIDHPTLMELARLLYRLELLMQAGRGESPEADDLRERMDGLGADLSREEVEAMKGISADLYSLSDPPHQALPMPEDAAKELLRLPELVQSKCFHAAFDLLRNHEKLIPPARLALERYRIWSALGEDEIAADFLRLAFKNDLRWTELTVDERQAAREHCMRIVSDPEKHQPTLVRSATAIVLTLSADLSESDLKLLITASERDIQRLEREKVADNPEDARAFARHAQLLKTLGRVADAIEVVNRGLEFSPDNTELLAVRGPLIFVSDPEQAYRDCDRVVSAGKYPPDVCLLLAHRALEGQNYRECLRFCIAHMDSMNSHGLKPSGQALALLMEWSAISHAGLGYPAEIVDAFFDEAIRLTRGNDNIRQNKELFHKHSKIQSPFDWQKETPETVSKIAETIFRPAA